MNKQNMKYILAKTKQVSLIQKNDFRLDKKKSLYCILSYIFYTWSIYIYINMIAKNNFFTNYFLVVFFIKLICF